MAQPIKYNTGTKTSNCCIRKGNYDIGVVTGYEYGPTSGTGFYAGYTIPAGGFVSYQNKASQGPSIYNIPSVDDLVAFGTQLNIGTQTTPQDVLFECANTTAIALVNIDYPEIPYQGGLATLDAGYTASYPWTNTFWFDVTGNENMGGLTGSCAFISGTSTYNYSDSAISMPSASQEAMVLVPAFAGTLSTFTVNIWINLGTGNYSPNVNVVGQQYSTSPIYTPETNCNFLIRGNGSGGYEGLIRAGNSNYTVDFGPISAGGWRNLTLTWNGTELVAYVSGNMVNSTNVGPIVGLTTNGLQTIIGGTTNAYASIGSPADYFDGRVNVVNIYDVALSSSEVNVLYDAYRVQRGL